MTRLITSTGVSARSPMWAVTPALFTSPVTAPNWARVDPKSSSTSAGWVTSAADRQTSDARLPGLGHHLGGGTGVGAVAENKIVAFAREAEHRSRPDAPATPRYDCHLAAGCLHPAIFSCD